MGSQGHWTSVAVSVFVSPPRFTVSVTLSPGLSVLRTSPSGVLLSSFVPLTAVMMSPAWRPAFAAGVP